MPAERPEADMRVLVLAPTARDGEATTGLLSAAGISCVRCNTLHGMCAEFTAGTASLILPEEAVLDEEFERLSQAVERQPVWSDIPVIVLSRAAAEIANIDKIMAALGNVSVIERPMRVSTFLSVVRGAIRARERQYQVRDHLLERHAAEEALARDAMLLTNVRDSVIVTDLAGNVTYWNDGATHLFGWTAEEMIGKPLVLRLPQPSRSEVAAWIAKIATGESEFDGEWLDYRKDGSRVWIEATTRLARARNGEPMGIIGVARDITQRKEAEAELKKAKDAAERANLAKDEFLAVLSHELRTPLTPVLLTASMLEASPLLAEELRPDVAMIRQNVELESQLIGDLLDVTRIAKGKLQLDIQELDLHQMIRAAIAICQRESGAKLTVDLRASRHTVRGDSTRLQQIFWNLINNAIKFTGVGGVIIVRSFDVPGAERVRVEVCDTGEGIDPKVLPRLFGAFEQGDVRTGRQRAGLGLGLSISRKLAELHGGTVSAFSAGQGQGATFTVELPAIEAPHRPRSSAPSVNAPNGGGVFSVLLIEDHEATLNALSKLLRLNGHTVTGATSVAAAMAAAEFNAFDVIVSDLGLPDGSGLDVMRHLHDRYAGRAIALTGYGMDADIAASRKAGFTEHFTKPVDLSALDAAIRRIASRHPAPATADQ